MIKFWNKFVGKKNLVFSNIVHQDIDLRINPVSAYIEPNDGNF